MSIDKTNVSSEMSDRGRFAMIPNELWEMKINIYAKFIWCYLLSQSENWESSKRNIARNLELDIDTVRKYIDELVNNTMLIEINIPGRRTDFEIIPPSRWVKFSTSRTASPTFTDGVPHTKEEEEHTNRKFSSLVETKLDEPISLVKFTKDQRRFLSLVETEYLNPIELSTLKNAIQIPHKRWTKKFKEQVSSVEHSINARKILASTQGIIQKELKHSYFDENGKSLILTDGLPGKVLTEYEPDIDFLNELNESGEKRGK
jgi:hypothetical protein